MGYSEPVGEESVSSGGAYSIGFSSTVDPNVRISIEMGDGDGGEFFGADSDALVQDIIDRLSASDLLTFNGASRSWRMRRDISATPLVEEPVPEG